MSLLKKVFLGVRATVFWLGFALSTLLYGLVSPVLNFIPYPKAYGFLVSWCRFNLWWLRLTCGIAYQVQGKENIPQMGAAIVMANHQSTWETLALATIFPPITWVLKKELLSIPFFGWGLRVIKPIAIDRSSGRNAVDQVKAQGKERLGEGIWVIVFPEGTRVKPGLKARYKLGGAILADYAGVPVVPVAHNAGESWPRHSYIKKSGLITVSIGTPITSTDKTPEALMQDVEAWIEAEKARLVFQPIRL